MSSLERMKNLFPKCPICQSDKGYEPSVFYPEVGCRVCKAEWSLLKDEMVLTKVSNQNWDKEFLNKKLSFAQWSRIQPTVGIEQVSDKIYAPMDYLGGHTDHKKRAIGYILIKSNGLRYIASEGSLYKMDVDVPLERLKSLEIRTSKEITMARWFMIGAWAILFKEKKEYLVVSYEDEAKLLQHMIFDFHGQRNNVDELVGLLSYMKKKAVGKQ